MHPEQKLNCSLICVVIMQVLCVCVCFWRDELVVTTSEYFFYIMVVNTLPYISECFPVMNLKRTIALLNKAQHILSDFHTKFDAYLFILRIFGKNCICTSKVTRDSVHRFVNH